MSLVILAALVLSAAFSTQLDAATGVTRKIVISGPLLTQPLAISDANVGSFHVWEGPGVYVNGVEQTEGFIVQWSQGTIATRPSGLREFQVQFYAGCAISEYCASEPPRLVYQVTYAYDPLRNQGFVYLPGERDTAFNVNTAIWRGRGLEGNWFLATRDWDAFAQPIIAAALGKQR